MKLVSSLALCAALILGNSPTLAYAAKEKPVEAAKMTLSKEFRAAAGTAQAAIKANAATADGAVTAAEAAATLPDDKFVAAQLRLQVGSALKNQVMQQNAVLAMLNSGSALSNADAPRLNFYAGQFAYTANDFPKAVKYLTEAERLGYKSGNQDVLLLLAEANFKSNNVPGGLVFVEKAIAASTAAGTKPPESWYARASSVAYKAKLNSESAKWTRAQVRAYPTVDNWRSALVVYRDGATRDGNLNLDIFRLMRLTKSLAGERDYYEFASLATERGLPGEAKSVIDEGISSGAVPTSSRALTELRSMASAKIASDQASLAATEKQAGASATGRVASATGDAYLAYGQDAKAIALYKTALTKGGVDVDAVNTRMGIALMRSGDKAGSRAAFSAVKGARADIAAFWLLWLDQQA
jgi:tetratricopeptide (TPR) repeat protein